MSKSKYRTIKGIIGKVSKFNEDLFDKYDTPARELLKNIFGDNIKDNDDKYGEDMIFTIKKFPYKYLEVQVSAMWQTEYPYKFPFVYARKMRFSKQTLFITFNKYMNEFILFSRNSILDQPEKLIKYSREYVNFVPWKNSLKNKTENLSLQLIKEFSGDFSSDFENEISI